MPVTASKRRTKPAAKRGSRKDKPHIFWSNEAEKRAFGKAFRQYIKSFRVMEKYTDAERVGWLKNLTHEEALRIYFGMKGWPINDRPVDTGDSMLRAVRIAADRLIASGGFKKFGQRPIHHRRSA